MKISKRQVEALLERGAFERGPVDLKETSVKGVLTATFSPREEAEAMRGPITLLVTWGGNAINAEGEPS